MEMRQGKLMTVLRFILMTMMAVTVLSAPASAQNNIDARLVAESTTPAAGSTVMLALDMRPKAGWHGYWKNPGDAGFGALLDWTLPRGATVGAVRYPVPERLVVSGLMNHVFNGNHALLVPLTLPAGLAKGTVLPLSLKGQWLACTDQVCVPEQASLSIILRVGDGAVTPAARAQYDGWRARFPRPLGAKATFEQSGDTLRIGIPYPANLPANDPWFFAETEDAVAYGAPQSVTRDGDLLIVSAKTAGSKPVAQLVGVLAFGKDMGLEIAANAGVVPVGTSGGGMLTLLLALGGAILGGVFLNVMPCVFPVISLKAMSLARAGGDPRDAKREALAYGAGVMATCVALGGALLALRAGGAQVGWAFQLQEPRVILFLLLLVTAVSFNLAGLFHLNSFGGGDALTQKKGAAGSFWTGVLAAFVATPCTGPFMAAALGAALVLPVAAALAIFAGLGFGLALPFLLIGFVPALRNRMPRPGPWMATFQRILSVPMFLTAAALVWLLWRQTGHVGLLIALAGFTVSAVILWLIGQAQRKGRAVLSLVGAFLALGALLIIALPKGDATAKPATVEGAEPFTEARLATLRTEGRPVFAYFTADWCVTCKVNEKAAIEGDEVRAAFKKAGVTVLVGDWTGGDPVIGRFLESHGRSGVPLYLSYPKGGGEPTVLPQVLTPGMLVDLTR